MTGSYLALIIGLTSALGAFAAIRRKDVGWSVVNGAFAIASGAGYLLAPERAGLWLVGPYLLLAVIPIFALVGMNRMLAARRYRAAAVLARIAFVLHPSKSHRRLLQFNDAFGLAARGQVDEAAAILREIGHEHEMQLEILRLQNRWDDIVTRIETSGKDPLDGPVSLYLRALGETGRIERLVEVYRAVAEKWRTRDSASEEVATMRLFVAAYLGQPALVEAICAGPLRHYDSSIQRYWLAMAHAAGGDRERAAALWDELARDGEQRMQAAAAHRKSHPPVRIDELPPALAGRAAEVVAEIERDVRDSARYSGHRTAGARPVLSYAIAALLVVIHVYAWWRTQDDPLAIYDLGLFWSPAVLEDGAWWRVVTAVFLHASWMHLAMNVLALSWFGPFVERFLGRLRFAIVYLAGGIGGFAVLAALDALGWREPTAALGASGAVMALIGASTAIFLLGSSRSPIAAARLRDMLLFVGLQVVFDILAPRVSMTAHVAGLVIGFVLGLAIGPRDRR